MVNSFKTTREIMLEERQKINDEQILLQKGINAGGDYEWLTREFVNIIPDVFEQNVMTLDLHGVYEIIGSKKNRELEHDDPKYIRLAAIVQEMCGIRIALAPPLVRRSSSLPNLNLPHLVRSSISLLPLVRSWSPISSSKSGVVESPPPIPVEGGEGREVIKYKDVLPSNGSGFPRPEDTTMYFDPKKFAKISERIEPRFALFFFHLIRSRFGLPIKMIETIHGWFTSHVPKNAVPVCSAESSADLLDFELDMLNDMLYDRDFSYSLIYSHPAEMEGVIRGFSKLVLDYARTESLGKKSASLVLLWLSKLGRVDRDRRDRSWNYLHSLDWERIDEILNPDDEDEDGDIWNEDQIDQLRYVYLEDYVSRALKTFHDENLQLKEGKMRGEWIEKMRGRTSKFLQRLRAVAGFIQLPGPSIEMSPEEVRRKLSGAALAAKSRRPAFLDIVHAGNSAGQLGPTEEKQEGKYVCFVRSFWRPNLSWTKAEHSLWA